MKYRDEEWLKEQYHVKGLTQAKIAEKCCVTRPTIIRWMKKHGIEARSRGHSQAEGRYKDKDWLREKYWDEQMSVEEIGEVCGVAGQTVNYWRKKYDIDSRDPSEAISLSWEGEDDRRERQRKLCAEVVRPQSPSHKHGEIPPETIEKMSEVKRGEKNPMWAGGYEGEYGYMWSAKRVEALERDGYECRVCGVEENLHVHHKVPRRHFDDPNDAHYLINLITACETCHPKLEKISRRTLVCDVQI